MAKGLFKVDDPQACLASLTLFVADKAAQHHLDNGLRKEMLATYRHSGHEGYEHQAYIMTLLGELGIRLAEFGQGDDADFEKTLQDACKALKDFASVMHLKVSGRDRAAALILGAAIKHTKEQIRESKDEF